MGFVWFHSCLRRCQRRSCCDGSDVQSDRLTCIVGLLPEGSSAVHIGTRIFDLAKSSVLNFGQKRDCRSWLCIHQAVVQGPSRAVCAQSTRQHWRLRWGRICPDSEHAGRADERSHTRCWRIAGTMPAGTPVRLAAPGTPPLAFPLLQIPSS